MGPKRRYPTVPAPYLSCCLLAVATLRLTTVPFTTSYAGLPFDIEINTTRTFSGTAASLCERVTVLQGNVTVIPLFLSVVGTAFRCRVQPLSLTDIALTVLTNVIDGGVLLSWNGRDVCVMEWYRGIPKFWTH